MAIKNKAKTKQETHASKLLNKTITLPANLISRILAVVFALIGLGTIYYGWVVEPYKAYGAIFIMLGITVAISSIEIWTGKDFSEQ